MSGKTRNEWQFEYRKHNALYQYRKHRTSRNEWQNEK
jgi:hypothetical protein